MIGQHQNCQFLVVVICQHKWITSYKGVGQKKQAFKNWQQVQRSGGLLWTACGVGIVAKKQSGYVTTVKLFLLYADFYINRKLTIRIYLIENEWFWEMQAQVAWYCLCNKLFCHSKITQIQMIPNTPFLWKLKCIKVIPLQEKNSLVAKLKGSFKNQYCRLYVSCLSSISDTLAEYSRFTSR